MSILRVVLLFGEFFKVYRYSCTCVCSIIHVPLAVYPLYDPVCMHWLFYWLSAVCVCGSQLSLYTQILSACY